MLFREMIALSSENNTLDINRYIMLISNKVGAYGNQCVLKFNMAQTGMRA